MNTKTPIFSLIFALVSFCFPPGIYAGAPSPYPDLSKKLAQTIAPLFSITIRDYFIASRWNRPGTANSVELQTLVPFKIWGQENLTRLSIPFRTESELGPGLSDVRVFDLLMFKTGTGFWGIGPVFNLGIYKGPGIDSFQAGPAATALFAYSKSLSIGLLNQNFFNDQVAISTVQPILVFNPGSVWTISLGELPLVYNWNKGEFSVLSIGLQLGALIQIAEQPIRFFVNPQFNTKSNTQLYHWTLAMGVTLPIIPIGPESNHSRGVM